jgi:hypothetical protein
MSSELSLFVRAWVFVGAVLAAACGALAGHNPPSDPPGRDAVLDWNAVLLAANRQDHSGTFGPAEQGGPTRTSRAFAIVHIAMYDAVNSIYRTHEPYTGFISTKDPSVDAAVAQAAHDTLVALYPAQTAVFDAALANYLAGVANGAAKHEGRKLGRTAAARILRERQSDGSDRVVSYEPVGLPGEHREDPENPGQGFLGPEWGQVRTFGIPNGKYFRAPPPPALTSDDYTAAYNDVMELGGDGHTTPTLRSKEQTEIGLFWAYDGTIGLGTPPRLYNQIARVIAAEKGNSEAQNARLFALINIAMADGGITCWETKYFYAFWRPILGIRESDLGTGPSGLGDGNPDTVGDTTWTPLGAPASNVSNGGKNFTPPFPAYTSGHATFCAAALHTIFRFYDQEVAFEFQSDEFNGITTDNLGKKRRKVTRSFDSLTEAIWENAQSRIYLGIHWQFDATGGVVQGESTADYVFDHLLRPR